MNNIKEIKVNGKWVKVINENNDNYEIKWYGQKNIIAKSSVSKDQIREKADIKEIVKNSSAVIDNLVKKGYMSEEIKVVIAVEMSYNTGENGEDEHILYSNIYEGIDRKFIDSYGLEIPSYQDNEKGHDKLRKQVQKALKNKYGWLTVGTIDYLVNI